ncbi:potassium channel family protein [Streptomyces sp. CRN 30]|uniref:potassium channel family protein n=1 Tax=Streptomyces sp. CRN 30 TaxID=3075613 RepID=UPI002A7EB700|nr:ion channel [Streptomyces sp. CRN 30]
MEDDSRKDHGRGARWERRAEVPLACTSMLFLAAYAVWVLAPGLSGAGRTACLGVLLTAWAVFAVDYAVRWRLSGRGTAFVRTHALDTLVLLLPLLRPLRLVRVHQAVLRRRGRPRLALYTRVMVYAGLSAVLLALTGALAVYQQEHAAPDASIRTFGDAVWWACATLATVGYGDLVPVTPVGRVVAVAMMICGLGFLGAVTGSFSSWLLQVFARESAEDDAGPPGS